LQPERPIIPIEKTLENPRAYEGRSITLSGTVTGRQSLLAVKYFSLKDDTGEIRVVTNRALPNIGSRTEVYGRVQQAFALGDQQLVVFVEDELHPSQH